MSYLAPVLPHMSAAAAAFLDAPLETWDAIQQPLLGRAIRPYRPLAVRLDPAAVASLVEPAPAEGACARGGRGSHGRRGCAGIARGGAAASIGIEDFARLDLRIARVAQAALVEGSDKLLRLTSTSATEERTVFSGIRAAYEPGQLVGRLVVMVANLRAAQDALRRLRRHGARAQRAAGGGGLSCSLRTPAPRPGCA